MTTALSGAEVEAAVSTGCMKRLSGAKWTIIRLGGLFVCSLLILVCVYATKRSSASHGKSDSLQSLYGVGDTVYARDLWLLIELESDNRGLRTKLGKASAEHVCAAIRAGQAIGWTPLVVGGRSKCCRSSTCRHLDPGDVETLNFSSALYFLNQHDDVTSALRNSAYLAAIQRGAHFIFEAQPAVYYQANVGPLEYEKELKRQLRKMTLGISVGLVKDSEDTEEEMQKFDPYTHFGPYYESSRSVAERIHQYKICEIRPPSLEKFLDTDGLSLDLSAPAVTVPGKLLAPFDTRNTFFGQDAFWSLLVLPDFAFRDSYVIRSMIAQALFPDVEGSTKFSIASENIYSHMDELTEANPVLAAVEKFIHEWTCDQSTVFECLRALVRDLIGGTEFFEENQSKIMNLWIRDLESVGYHDFPIIPREFSTSPCIGTDALHGVYFHPSTTKKSRSPKNMDIKPPTNHKNSSASFADDYAVTEAIINRLCPSVSAADTQIQDRHETILLIVNFHNSNYKSIPLFEVIYRHHFENILYCGAPNSSVDEYMEKYQGLSGSYFSFLPVYSKTGYECILGAIEMGYNVEGFLMVTQDTLVNSWNFHNLDTSVIWHSNEHLTSVSEDNFETIDEPDGKKKILRSAIGILRALEFLEDGLLSHNRTRRKTSNTFLKSPADAKHESSVIDDSSMSLVGHDISDSSGYRLHINLFGEIQHSSSLQNYTRNVTELFFHPANLMNKTNIINYDVISELRNGTDQKHFEDIMSDILTVYHSIGEKLDIWKSVTSPRDETVSDSNPLTMVDDFVDKNIKCDSSSNSEICYLVSNFFEVLQLNEEEQFRLFYDDLPIYYVPVADLNKEKLYLMANLFTKFHIHDEIAFPLLLRGLSVTSTWIELIRSAVINTTVAMEINSPDDLLNFNSEIRNSRQQLNRLENAHYLYPVSTETVLQNEILRNIICKNF